MINRKQLYTNQTRSKVENEAFYCHSSFKCCAENILHGILSFFCTYFIPVYVKNYGFVMGFVILAIYFQLSNSF